MFPTELSDVILGARQALNESTDGRLPLPWRRRIRAAFGPLDGGRATPGWIRRWRLGLRCVNRALRRWRAEHPDDQRPERIVELANAVFAGELDAKDAAVECLGFLDDLTYDSDRFSVHAYFAGNAAAALVRVAALGDHAAELPADTTDKDLEPDAWDAEGLAAAAEASVPGDQDDDPARRHDFWLWYLREAVPAAYAAADADTQG